MATNVVTPPRPVEDKRDLSIKEGAYLIGVSYWWLHARIGKTNGPPYKKRGKLIILPRDQFLVWAAQDNIP